MIYNEVRDNIKDGDLIAFSGKKLLSRLIQKVTYSVISHVGMAVWIKNRLFVIEAVEGAGIRFYPLSKYVREGSKVEWWKLYHDSFNVDREKVIIFAMDRVGDAYGLWQLIKDFFLRTKDHKKGNFYCSLYVLEALKEGGYIGEGFDDTNPSPGEITRLPCFHRQGYLEQL